MGYYNTTPDPELKQSKRTAGKQVRRILNFFKNNKGKRFAPHIIAKNCQILCVGSVKRAMTDLTNEGILRKTDFMVPGEYGKPVHTWEFKQSTNQNEIW